VLSPNLGGAEDPVREGRGVEVQGLGVAAHARILLHSQRTLSRKKVFGVAPSGVSSTHRKPPTTRS
jgi:hypothetical protein